jgi:phosphoglucosamine mutase
MPERLFGTDGIRGKAGQYPLDDKTVALIGRLLAENLARQLGRSPTVIIGRDTRQSGSAIESALAGGLAGAGARVLSAGILTTPGVAYITRANGFDAGIVISASHNPYQDNGIKVFAPSGQKLQDKIERRIEEDLSETLSRGIDRAPHQSLHLEPDPRYVRQYINYLIEEVAGSVRLDGLRLALDCANGAASEIAPEVFARLGAQITLVAASPNGRNINENCGSLHLELLRQTVLERGLDLGIAFDGDADRAMFVDSRGEVVDGDQTMFILAESLKSREKLRGNLVVATVMSNMGLELALKSRGINLLRTPVGDRFVLEGLLAHGASLGGEQSGHIILPEISLAGDGIITAIELLSAVRESGRRLEELASQMTKFPQVLLSVPVRSKPPLEGLPEVSAEMKRIELELQGCGRLLVRYSGTEDLARIMLEGQDQKEIQQMADRLASLIKRAIG